MVTTLNAHFDGKAIVPDEPLPSSIPSGARLKVHIETVQAPMAVTPVPRVVKPLDIDVDPEVAKAIGSDPAFDIENS